MSRKQKTFFKQLEQVKETSHAAPVLRPPRRFTWKDNVVAPREPAPENFQAVAKPAPRVQAEGAQAPVTHELPALRAATAAARAAKKEKS